MYKKFLVFGKLINNENLMKLFSYRLRKKAHKILHTIWFETGSILEDYAVIISDIETSVDTAVLASSFVSYCCKKPDIIPKYKVRLEVLTNENVFKSIDLVHNLCFMASSFDF